MVPIELPGEQSQGDWAASVLQEDFNLTPNSAELARLTWSGGLTLSGQQNVSGLNIGLSADTTVTQGEKTTSGTSMRVMYSASTIATDTSATEIDGSFGDDRDFDTPDCQKDSGQCYAPSVQVYIDELFGSYIFRDAKAPLAPWLTFRPEPVRTTIERP